MRLLPRDLDVLNRAVLEMYAPESVEALHHALPAIVLRAIPADYFRILECTLDPTTGAMRNFRYWESQPRIDADLQRQFARWTPQHPFIKAAQPTGNLGAVKLSDFLSDRQFLGSCLYREMYDPIDVGRMMGASIGRGARLWTFTASRHVGGRDFSERDRDMLALLRPHIDAARDRAEAREGFVEATGAPLTSREAQVARWMACGKTNAEIATILAMRPRTAEKHVEHVLAKLGAKNRTSASLTLAGAARRARHARGAAR